MEILSHIPDWDRTRPTTFDRTTPPKMGDLNGLYTVRNKDNPIYDGIYLKRSTEIVKLSNDLDITYEIIDNLISDYSDKALSAKQGKILNEKKVDKEVGKGLSSNDFTDEHVQKLTDAVASITALKNTKVDKELGKGLSTNDFTDFYKETLDNLDVSTISYTLGKKDIVWDKGWVSIWLEPSKARKDVVISKFYIVTSKGRINLNPIYCFPSAPQGSTTFSNAILIKDTNDILNELCSFEQLHISFAFKTDTTRANTRRFILGENVFDLEYSGNESHAAEMVRIFKLYLPNFEQDGYIVNSNILLIPKEPNVYNQNQPEFAERYNCNMFLRPYVNAASSEEGFGNEDIIEICSHYDNTFTRRDITNSENTFKRYTVAIAARVNDTTTQSGSSYGYGVEFFIDFSRNGLLRTYYPFLDTDSLLYRHEQSGACAIAGAMFKEVRLATNCSWDIIRDAIRKTASNSIQLPNGSWSTNWDMYRGFGMPRTDLAIQYIKNKYIDNVEYKRTLADSLEGLRQINPILTLDDIHDNSPVSKKMLLKLISELNP